jgi:hypothetical protein
LEDEFCQIVWNQRNKDIWKILNIYWTLLLKQIRIYHPYLWVSCFPWNSIWRVKAHSRVALLVWVVAVGKILTLDNLRKRNIIVVDWCCMRKKSEEFIVHLLYFELARDLWNSLFNLFGVVVMPRRVRKLLMSCGGQVGLRNILEVWRLAFLCLMWCIWRKMNEQNFGDREILVV